MTTPLTQLGWDETWATHALPASTRPARVTRTDRDRCEVMTDDGDDLVTVTAVLSAGAQRARRADPTTAPVTGDWVALRLGDDRTEVELVLPRRTTVVRPQVDGSSHGQALAANADVAAILVAAAPAPDAGLVERMLALAWASGARPVAVLTKADLVDDAPVQAADLERLAPGVEVLVTSAVTGAGLEPLRTWLSGGATIALLGRSGAGKSTLLNALVGRDVMRTRGLQADGTGRHTTVTRELHPVPGGGAVLDTPGLRTVGIVDGAAVTDVFAEITDLADGCRFRDCRHTTEPGCAVLAAVDSGDLEPRRLAGYRAMLREAHYRASRTDARLRGEALHAHKLRILEYRRRPDKKR